MKKILTILLFLISLNCFSQKDSTICNRDTLHFNILVGGQLTAGNFNNFGFSASSDLRKVHKRDFWSVSPSFRITMLKSSSTSKSYQKKELEFYSNQSYERKYDKWKFILFSEIEHSYLRKVKFRTDIGIGGGYQFINNKRVLIDLTEVILPDFYISDTMSRDNFTLRSSTRLKFILRLDPVTISSINLFQPELCGWDFLNGHIINPADNINFRSTTTIDVMIKRGFSIGGKLDYIYQTYPHFISENSVVKISPYDIVTSVYIKWTI